MNGLYTKLDVFTELMGCVGNLYVWHYDNNLKYIESNCPDPRYWDNIFQSATCYSIALDYCRENQLPVLLSNPIGLLWIAVPLRELDALSQVFVLGPVFLSTFVEEQLENTVNSYGASMLLKRDLINHLKQLPVVIHTTFMLFGTMLYYCLTGTKINISDISMASVKTPVQKQHRTDKTDSEEIHGGAEYESLMLQLIEEGNLHYKEILSANKHGRVGTLAPGDSLRQFKDEIITAVTLCSRAGIRGGLSRELALTLSDHYIQSIEAASTIPEVGHIKQAMQEDFTQRVHKRRQEQILSPAIRTCLDYIQQNITEKITISDIARATGYAGYYISSLFRKELSVGIGDYVKRQKIEYAKLLLKNSDTDISEIAERLHFSTPSYFSAIFKEYAGVTPSEYRAAL